VAPDARHSPERRVGVFKHPRPWWRYDAPRGLEYLRRAGVTADERVADHAPRPAGVGLVFGRRISIQTNGTAMYAKDREATSVRGNLFRVN
jgi:hypothetical protein